MTRAGLPTTVAPSGTLLITTAPGPIVAPTPIRTPPHDNCVWIYNDVILNNRNACIAAIAFGAYRDALEYGDVAPDFCPAIHRNPKWMAHSQWVLKLRQLNVKKQAEQASNNSRLFPRENPIY